MEIIFNKKAMQTDLLIYDKSDLLGTTALFPEAALQALKNTEKITLPEVFQRVNKIIISGMGGSCISGDILRSWLWQKSSLPIFVNRSAILPEFADEQTLCIFISYSGNTKETLNCAGMAVKKGCKNIAITHGGSLQNFALKENFLLIPISGKEKMPRAAIGELFYSLAGVLSEIKALGIDQQELEKSIQSLFGLAKKYDLQEKPDNELFLLARKIYQRPLAIFGVSPYTEAIASRWKTQFNENSKKTVIFNNFPELTHNEVVGLGENKQDYFFLILRDRQEDLFQQKQIENTLSLITSPDNYFNFYGEEESFLCRLLTLLYTGDYLSIYLAILNGFDPSPIELIFALKEKMKDID